MDNKVCFMFGHGDCPDGMLPLIEEAIEMHYSKHEVRDFYVGNRGRFDSLAATAAKRVKQRHPDMGLYLVLAYHPAERAVDLGHGFDASYYPKLESTPRPYAIVKANQHMVDIADTLICYVKHVGNARKLLEYAHCRKNREHLPVCNLGE